uniref:Protein amnionless n=1 Tax=Strongyloides stercoralis TaxID=6248 RepID=A0A0K0EBV4_STRER
MNNLLLILLIINISIKLCLSYYSYELIFSNDFESQLGWKNHNTPCDNDIISFENNITNIISISQNFKFSSILLPSNGILYINDNIKIGKKGKWQCSNKNNVSHKKIYNVSYHGRANFYDSIHWRIKEKDFYEDYINPQTLLHYKRVPDSQSTVVIPYGISTQIESKKTINIQRLINRYQVSLLK